MIRQYEGYPIQAFIARLLLIYCNLDFAQTHHNLGITTLPKREDQILAPSP